ncbi:oxidoreductase [Pseudonocardia sp. HH130629-09]|uniref:oxidoreductase n=1 Tax=Pseudonocardia sp. HH130629-09 TaxID=1641402 RepID=UPI0006CB18A6|nr:oxidoreductase [Pseudonocardia sp. HH130629-09]ALE86645.1 oxidoreductase [Pseudonocardia sp. HH130629-09]
MTTRPGGELALAPDLVLSRLGLGTMQLAGPGVWGPPTDPDAAARVLRDAVDAGVTHLDTADFYGPHVVTELLRRTLHPYPDDLRIATKVGFRRGPDRSWQPAPGPDQLVADVHDNLRRLRVDALDLVNLRVGDATAVRPGRSLAAGFTALAELQQQGLVRHLGVSNVTAGQLDEARTIAPVVCVQNAYGPAHRDEDPLVDRCAAEGIAYVPFFPLAGLDGPSGAPLRRTAAALGVSTARVALAWLLQRSPTMLPIPGTSRPEHLHDNLAAGELAGEYTVFPTACNGTVGVG